MIRCGLICKKIGMSQIFSQSGEAIPVTILDAESNWIVSVLNDGNKVLVKTAAFDQKPQRLSKSVLGEFSKAKVVPKKVIRQFTVDSSNSLKAGDSLSVGHFKVGQFIDVTGTTIGKGYAGVMKRHNFKGLEASHGVSVSHRSAGSTGQCQDPGKVFKGKKMAGRLGGVQNTIQNIEIVDIDFKMQLLIVRGSISGKHGGYLVL